MFAQRLANALGVAQCALDVLVDRSLFEEHDGFATGALPGIAALHASRLVAKDRLAAVTVELNGIVHLVFPRSALRFFGVAEEICTSALVRPSSHSNYRSRL